MGKRGEKLRPCARCRTQIKFVRWTERADAEKKNIWHWVNEDGTHHYCRTGAEQINAAAEMHMAAITTEGV